MDNKKWVTAAMEEHLANQVICAASLDFGVDEANRSNSTVILLRYALEQLKQDNRSRPLPLPKGIKNRPL